MTCLKAKEKYRRMFEIQKSGDKTSSGQIHLDIRTHESPKVGQDQVSGGVSVLCWHAAPVAYALWKPCTISSQSASWNVFVLVYTSPYLCTVPKQNRSTDVQSSKLGNKDEFRRDLISTLEHI